VIVQGVGDTYTATAAYQRPVVTRVDLPLSNISELDGRNTDTLSPAPVPPLASLPRRQHRLQQQGDESGVNRLSDTDHYYSEIHTEAESSSSSSSLSSSLSSAAASASHVTETDTPTKEVHGADAADAVYSGLDTATVSEPTSSPSVYQTLNDTDRAVSSSSS